MVRRMKGWMDGWRKNESGGQMNGTDEATNSSKSPTVHSTSPNLIPWLPLELCE